MWVSNFGLLYHEYHSDFVYLIKKSAFKTENENEAA
jgi:hypothetical protein